ncbi:MAG: sulfate permease, SulP family [Herbinix sp.]|jgi:SulP family sulfate permease|nr:sulfate permease, SulP family [Herbinix sp.]
MDKLKPKLFSVMKTYTKEQFVKDVIAGIIVAIIALPLSIALALASGVTPERGLYTAIVAGFVISFLGGSRVQISGPTAAFATIVAGIVAKNGMEGLVVATIMAGIMLIVMGLLKFGRLLKFIPFTITTGFTLGIAVTIFIGQIKDFLGLTLHTKPVETIEKLFACFESIATINLQALLIGAISLAILILWPKINNKIPASLIAVVVAAAVVKISDMDVNTIGSLYEISSKPPTFQLPKINLSMINTMFPDAITIAVLAGVESLLSCVVADGMIGSKHRSNMELVAQGTGNILSSLFGGIPATGAIARTAANVKNGGRTPIAGMVHAVTLFLILVVLMPYAALIPMPTIAAILFMVAYNMSDWREFVSLVKKSPKSDILVLVTTFALTVIFDLVVAIEIGILMAAILFVKRMADVADIQKWTDLEDEGSEDDLNDPDNIRKKKVPKNTLVYEINGPMFFGAADKFMDISLDSHVKIVILRMKSVPAMDVNALHTLNNVMKSCKKKHITLILSHVQDQPLKMMQKAGFDKSLGEENFCDNIDQALERAEMLQRTMTHHAAS